MDAYLLDAVRTPFGRNRGGLATVRTDDLAALPIAELARRHPEAQIDEVILGDTNGAGEDNRNVARMAALLAGLPVTVPGVTVNRLCASGGEAILQAARMLTLDDASVVIAGGVEGMSRAPHVLPVADTAFPRTVSLVPTQVGWRMTNPKFPDAWTASLGACAERVADGLGIGRPEQDDWAARSHTLAAAAWDAGLHDDWVLKVEGVARDESIRPGTTREILGALRPAFTPEGTVTAGNSSPINDGAVAVLMGTAESVRRLGAAHPARVVAGCVTAGEPDRFAVAPVPAIMRLLSRQGLRSADIDVWEINEAFAAMVLSTLHELRGEGADIPEARINLQGGAIAIGHPLGASMPRVIVDCARQLARRGGGYGIAAACIGVGQGMAVLLHVDEWERTS